MIKTKRINLSDKAERSMYSEKLQAFENEFTYPLGDAHFHIVHGAQGDYFSFFERLGKPEFLLLEHNHNVIGAVCLVLRNINGKNVWYACDFKIAKAYRGQKLFRKWMRRFFVPFYMKSQSLFGINMSSPDGNKLLHHTQSILKVFDIGVKPYYLYEFNAINNEKLGQEFWSHHAIITNNGFKDIVIEGVDIPLYHIVRKNHLQQNLKMHYAVDSNKLSIDSNMMVLSKTPMNLPFAKQSIISLIHRKSGDVYISSAEI